MKISVSYQELSEVINFSSGILSDKSVEEKNEECNLPCKT